MLFIYPPEYFGIFMTVAAAAVPVSVAAAQVVPSEAVEVVSFWRDAGPSLWFAKDPEFDAKFRDRFLSLHEKAAHGELDVWAKSPDGALALLILLDQFPRNAFRGTPRMYATDVQARAIAHKAVDAGFDKTVDSAMRLFVYLPFGHSEYLADQDLSVLLSKQLDGVSYEHAKGHHDIIARFGRFPHRNLILGRAMRPEEQHYLDNGGFKG